MHCDIAFMHRFIGMLLLLSVLGAVAAAVEIPRLNWRGKRSDWIDVKTDVTPAAKGDGMTDDTAAIQAALDALGGNIGNKKAVYLPPGDYKISRTLNLVEKGCVAMIGHGRDTRIFWDGAADGTMFWENGNRGVRYIGMIWDGMNKAAVGVDHSSRNVFCLFGLHLDEEFRRFTTYGIKMVNDYNMATPDFNIRNCLFCNNATALYINGWNNYVYCIDGNLFLDNNIGVGTSGSGNYNLYNCHFERSAICDILMPMHGSGVRRCTSVGSGMFIAASAGCASRIPWVIEDCQVSGWKNASAGAIWAACGGPVTISDCVFTNPPSAAPPVNLANWDLITLRVLSSQNSSAGTRGVFRRGVSSSITDITGRKRKPVLTSARQSFFQQTDTYVAPTGKVFDARVDFGAVGNGNADDTVAIQRCIDAAKNAGNDAIAYLPSGSYKITNTLTMDGSNYRVGGSGDTTCLQWANNAVAGPIVRVTDPQHVRMEFIAFNGGNKVVFVQQHSLSGGRSSMEYDYLYGRYGYDGAGGGADIELLDLPSGARVFIQDMSAGMLRVKDCARATIFIKYIAEMSTTQVLNPAHYPKTGFIGMDYTCGIVDIRDNSDFVLADFYAESGPYMIKLSGDGNFGSQGHVTIPVQRGAPLRGSYCDINNYFGRVCFISGCGQGAQDGSITSFALTGTQPVDLVVAGFSFQQSGYTGPMPSWKVDLSCRQITVENSLGTDGVNSREGRAIPESRPDGWMAPIAAGFDDLAELGQHDLDFSFPHSKRTSTFASLPGATASQLAKANSAKVPTPGEMTALRKVVTPTGAIAGAQNPRDGATLVYVPAGEFLMGCKAGDGGADESPQHPVYLDGYWMYQTEVTVAQYRKFCQATGHAAPYESWKVLDDQPVINVSWYDAAAYAQWAGVCLPTEAQWEKAARGTDGRMYPWGNDWDPAKCIATGSKPQTVGSIPANTSPYGCLDMAGNLKEWCADWYDAEYYKHSPAKNPNGPATGVFRVLRGGSWDSYDGLVRSTYRYFNGGYPDNHYVTTGFRCVSPTPGP